MPKKNILYLFFILISSVGYTQSIDDNNFLTINSSTESKTNINILLIKNHHLFSDNFHTPYSIHYEIKRILDSLGFEGNIVQIKNNDSLFEDKFDYPLTFPIVLDSNKEMVIGILTNTIIFNEIRGLLHVDWEIGVRYLLQIRFFEDNSKIELIDKMFLVERRKGQNKWIESSILNSKFGITGNDKIDINRNFIISTILTYLNKKKYEY